jgi:hypothetical protein
MIATDAARTGSIKIRVRLCGERGVELGACQSVGRKAIDCHLMPRLILLCLGDYMASASVGFGLMRLPHGLPEGIAKRRARQVRLFREAILYAHVSPSRSLRPALVHGIEEAGHEASRDRSAVKNVPRIFRLDIR